MKIKAHKNNYIIKNVENKTTVFSANQTACVKKDNSRQDKEQKAREARKWCSVNQL